MGSGRARSRPHPRDPGTGSATSRSRLPPESAERPERAEQRTRAKASADCFARHDAGDDVRRRAVLRGVPGHRREDGALPAARIVPGHDPRRLLFGRARSSQGAATRTKRARMPGMDLPVSIAIGSAYVASVYATYTNGPAVWYDSVTMFVFFLSVATLPRDAGAASIHRPQFSDWRRCFPVPRRACRMRIPRIRTLSPSSSRATGCSSNRANRFPPTVCSSMACTSASESMLTGESTPVAKLDWGCGDRR